METPACLACTAPRLKHIGKGTLECQYCGSIFKGQPLVCPSCGWINTVDAQQCPECDEPLNVIAQVISRQDTSGAPLWLKRVQSQAEEIKKSEELASQNRLQRLQEIDRKREADIARQKEERSRTDRTFLFILSAGVVIILCIIAMLAIIIG